MFNLSISPEKQVEILSKGTIHFEVKDQLIKKIYKSKKYNTPMLLKVGFDPTSPDLHLGHSVLLRKVKQFQELGHNVVFVIGDFTAKIGDPTGKNSSRPALSSIKIINNSKTYKEQILKILNPKQTIIKFNSQWLNMINFNDIINLFSNYSVARIIERYDFKKRLKNNNFIGMHEFIYPIIQGYDSVVLRPDIELGGNDQLFNLLVGRDLMKNFKFESQCIMTVPLLEGIFSKEINGKIVGDKMSKSLKNDISINESPRNQFGKLMSISDQLMWRYYELLSSKSKDEIIQLKKKHPKEAKECLALEIVSCYSGINSALRAKEEFYDLFGSRNKSKIPKDLKSISIKINDEKINIIEILIKSKLISSNSEGKRIIRSNCLRINGVIINDIRYFLILGSYSIRIGKKRWASIILT